MNNNLKLFFNNIIELKINNINININTINFNIYNKKYHLFINNKKYINKKNNIFYIKFRCVSCNSIVENNVYKRFINRINNNNIIYCKHCTQKFNIDMKKYRSENLKNKPLGTKYKKINNVIFNPLLYFRELSLEDKELYWKRNFKYYEWKNFIKTFNIIKVNNIKIENIKFIPISKTNNQYKISNKLFYNNNIITIKNLISKCELCNNEYKIKFDKSAYLCNHKKNNLCRDCVLKYKFQNKKFPVRITKNINNDNIIYMSKYEKNFIDFCNMNNINIINGPKIEYIWNNKKRFYFLDFYIPKLKTIIELKDMHIWHKNEIKNNKWYEKEKSIYSLINENNLYNEYILLFKKDFNNIFKNNLIKCYNEDIV